MRKTVAYLLITIAAIVLAIAPRFVVYGTDNFTVMPDNHKAFIYGFPFRITDGPPAADTPASEAALRLIGNFLVFFAGGALFVTVAHRLRLGQRHED